MRGSDAFYSHGLQLGAKLFKPRRGFDEFPKWEIFQQGVSRERKAHVKRVPRRNFFSHTRCVSLCRATNYDEFTLRTHEIMFKKNVDLDKISLHFYFV